MLRREFLNSLVPSRARTPPPSVPTIAPPDGAETGLFDVFGWTGGGDEIVADDWPTGMFGDGP
jgi:hypothetical protein